MSVLIMYVAIKIFVHPHPFWAAEQVAAELTKSKLAKWHFVHYALLKNRAVIFGISLVVTLCAFALFYMVSRREGLVRRIGYPLRVTVILLVLAGAVLNAYGIHHRCPGIDRRPNIIFIFFDALRADHLGCYGYERDTSPCIDEIAGGGIRCKNVYAQGSATCPSVHCIVASQYANSFYKEGVRDKIALGEEYLTVAEVLKNYGYFTVGITSSPIVTRRGTSFGCGGFEQGFDHFDSSACFGKEYNWQYRSPEGVIEKSLAWLRRNRGKKFFMLLYIMDPHDRYVPPAPYNKLYDPDYRGKSLVEEGVAAPYQERQLYGKPVDLDSRDIRHFIAMYDGEIRYADATLARLWGYLKTTGLLNKTLVVVMSDHGEEFYDHGGLKHNHTLYNELISVPVIFHYEGSTPRGIVVDGEILQAIDVVPTILDYAGIPKPSVMQGESILTLLGRRDGPWRDYALSENLFIGAKAFITKEWKYIHHFGSGAGYCEKYTAGSELYNVMDDPKERNSLCEAFPDRARHLHERMMAVLPASERERLGEGAVIELDQSARQRLRALGYVQ
jgi:arylsulfatase A-like enzyme